MLYEVITKRGRPGRENRAVLLIAQVPDRFPAVGRVGRDRIRAVAQVDVRRYIGLVGQLGFSVRPILF